MLQQQLSHLNGYKLDCCQVEVSYILQIVRVTLLLVVYRQWVHLGAKPFEDHGQILRIVKVKITLQLVVYCKSVHLGAKPLEAHNQISFF
jgi:hypothetical protein